MSWISWIIFFISAFDGKKSSLELHVCRFNFFVGIHESNGYVVVA
jgi:hypothetical protein